MPQPYSNLLRLLSNLAQSAVAIPFDMAREKVEEINRIDHGQWMKIASEIAKAIEPASSALTIQHASDEESLQRSSMLWDDLADIYRDLRYGLDLYAVGDSNHTAEALWQWRFGYENHWGDHLFRALTTVHEIRFRLYLE